MVLPPNQLQSPNPPLASVIITGLCTNIATKIQNVFYSTTLRSIPYYSYFYITVLTVLCSKLCILRILHFTHVLGLAHTHAHCCCSCIQLKRSRRSALNLYRLEETLRNRLRLLASVIPHLYPCTVYRLPENFHSKPAHSKA